MSYVRVDFVHEEDSSQPTRRFRATRSAAPTPPESPASFFPSLRLCLRNLVGKHTQLPLVEHGCIHHANQNLFDRTVAEPIDDALDRFRRNPSAWLRSMVRTVDSFRGRESRSRTASAVTGPLAQTSCITSRSRSPSAGRLSSIICYLVMFVL